jgi:isopentenyl diphosphate isomerase/L-lactate dehydrogenase-like FMN-dependent dehydrogenase
METKNAAVKDVSPAVHPQLPELLSIDHVLSVAEMQSLAMRCLNPKARSYYSSATDDQITKEDNNRIYQSVLLRPRTFVDCTECDLSTTVLGHKLSIPIHASPAAMATLAHPVGELGIAAACSSFNALYVISKNAAKPLREIVRAGPNATFAWQLYVLKDIDKTLRDLAALRDLPQISFLVLTVDAPFPGKRETEVRFKMDEVAAGAPPQEWGTEGGLTWKTTIGWLESQTNLPIVVKGIQTHEDAYAASLFPAVKGIILSNHGGRALDTATTPLQVLLEIRKFCPEVLTKVDVMVDGGIKRGTDVVKALALGAKAVGIGRPPLYGLAVGGQAGVERTLKSMDPLPGNMHRNRYI